MIYLYYNHYSCVLHIELNYTPIPYLFFMYVSFRCHRLRFSYGDLSGEIRQILDSSASSQCTLTQPTRKNNSTIS